MPTPKRDYKKHRITRKRLSNLRGFADRSHAPKIIKDLFDLIAMSDKTLAEISHEVGMKDGTISLWGRRTNPRIMNVMAVLQTIGYELKMVRVESEDARMRADYPTTTTTTAATVDYNVCSGARRKQLKVEINS